MLGRLSRLGPQSTELLFKIEVAAYNVEGTCVTLAMVSGKKSEAEGLECILELLRVQADSCVGKSCMMHVLFARSY